MWWKISSRSAGRRLTRSGGAGSNIRRRYKSFQPREAAFLTHSRLERIGRSWEHDLLTEPRGGGALQLRPLPGELAIHDRRYGSAPERTAVKRRVAAAR